MCKNWNWPRYMQTGLWPVRLPLYYLQLRDASTAHRERKERKRFRIVSFSKARKQEFLGVSIRILQDHHAWNCENKTNRSRSQHLTPLWTRSNHHSRRSVARSLQELGAVSALFVSISFGANLCFWLIWMKNERSRLETAVWSPMSHRRSCLDAHFIHRKTNTKVTAIREKHLSRLLGEHVRFLKHRRHIFISLIDRSCGFCRVLCRVVTDGWAFLGLCLSPVVSPACPF